MWYVKIYIQNLITRAKHKHPYYSLPGYSLQGVKLLIFLRDLISPGQYYSLTSLAKQPDHHETIVTVIGKYCL